MVIQNLIHDLVHDLRGFLSMTYTYHCKRLQNLWRCVGCVERVPKYLQSKLDYTVV
jgi:hypothetical protein